MTSRDGNQEWVTTLRKTDVLFGRGSGPNDHEGNVLFRSLVRARKSEYMATNHRQTKAKIAREIVDEIKAKNGRFLKKVEAADAKKMSIPKGVDAWVKVDDKTIMEKAKQALRQKAEKTKYDDEDGVEEQHPASAAVQKAPEIPQETLAHYAEDSMDPHGGGGFAPAPSDVRHGQTHVNWNAEQIPMYTPSQVPHSRPAGSYHLSEEPAPPQQVVDINHQRMAELERQRLAELEVHRNAVYGGGELVGEEEVGDGPEFDARRKSLQVEDLMRSFNRMGTDEMATSSSSNMGHDESTETMGTLEPLPMGASNVSMMSSSTFSIFKGALADTPRSSITRPAPNRRGSRSSESQKTGERSCSSDMSMSLSDAMWGESSGGRRDGSSGNNQISQVLEGKPGEEDSNATLGFEPRPLQQMAENPDNLSTLGNSSMTFIKAALGSNGSAMLGHESTDKGMGTSGNVQRK